MWPPSKVSAHRHAILIITWQAFHLYHLDSPAKSSNLRSIEESIKAKIVWDNLRRGEETELSINDNGIIINSKWATNTMQKTLLGS